MALKYVIAAILFLVPILAMTIYTPYEISYDQAYVEQVNQRALNYDGGGKVTDFTEATIMKYDAEGNYLRKQWKLQHQEIYWLINIGGAIFIGLFIAGFALMMSREY